MADLNALYQALRNADAAGDTEGATRLAQYIQQVQAQSAAPTGPAKQSTIGSELKRGAQQVASSMQTAYGALTGSPEEAAKAGIERGEAINQIAGEGVGFEPVKKAYQEKGLLSAAGEAVSQIPRALAGQGANLATMAGGARLGAAAGSLLGPAGTVVGGALGAGAAMLPQFFGSNVERQAAEQMEKGEPVKIDRTKAGVAAAGQAALEGAGTAFTLGKGVVKGVLGIADDAAITSAKAAQQLEATARRSLAASVGRGTAKGAVVEMPVEIAQQVIERAQAGLDLTSPDAMKEYGEAAYQAGLVGGPLGGAGNVVARGQAKDKLEAQAKAAEVAKQAEIAARGPQVPAEAPAGTQGEMFAEPEMGVGQAPKSQAAPAQPAAPEAPAAAQDDLGLDYQREYADLAKERERLRQQPQTPEVKARVQELTDQMALYTQSDIESLRAQKEADAATAKADEVARKKFPALANAPDLLTQPDEVKARTQSELFPSEDLAGPTLRTEEKGVEPTTPTPVPPYSRKGEYQYKLPLRGGEVAQPFTLQNVLDTGIAPSTTKGWFEKNVVGKTRGEVQSLVDADPTLIDGPGKRAKILRELLAPQAAPFKEAPSVKTPTPTPAVEQRDEPRAGEPSVGVPSEPTPAERPEPGPTATAPTAEPVTPDGSGLVPAGRPAVPGAETQGAEPTAVTPGRDNVKKTYGGYTDASGVPIELTIVRRPDGSVFRVFAKSADGLRKEYDTNYGPGISDEQIVQAIAEPSDWERATPAAPKAPDVDSIKSFSVGPSRVTPTVIARDKPTYHETNAEGLEDFARNDKQFEYSGAFVSDNPDLALGQGSNTGVFIEFRPNSISGQVHSKLGTSAATGQEYKSDVVAPKAISVVTIKDPASFKPGRMTARLLKAEFDKETLPDGSVQYTRKGVAASKALPITQTPEEEPTAVTPPTESARDLQTQIRALSDRQLELLDQSGRRPRAGTTKEKAWNDLQEQINALRDKFDAADRAERAAGPRVKAETAEEEAARKAEAEEVKRRLDEVEKQRAAPRAEPTPPAKPAPAPAKPAPAKAEVEEEVSPIQERPDPFAGLGKAAAEARARREAREKAAAPKAEPAVAIKTTWSGKHTIGGQQIVYEDSEVALVRAVNALGEVKYFAMDDSGNQAMNSLESRPQPSWLTAEQKQRLSAAMADAQINEHALRASNPDGPFTKSASNVVATDSLDPGIAKYAADLLKSIGLGDLRVFIYTAADIDTAGAVDKYKLYGAHAKPARYRKDSLNGSATILGPESDNTFAIYLKGGMTEGKTLEVLAHEIGHIVEDTAYENADPATKKAIQDEYMAWRKTARKATAGELMHMLRNREDAEWNVELLKKGGVENEPAAKVLQSIDSYWTGFGEWFADNVSRWATTNEKPLTITEKFFSKLAQKMRDLVAIVTGRKYPPAKSVADFLNAAGPADFRPNAEVSATPKNATREQFSVAPGTEALIDSMGPLDAEQKSGLQRLIDGFKTQDEVNYATKFRTQTADAAATIEHRLRERFDGAVRDSLGKFNPMGLYRQAQDHAKLLLEYFQQGSLVKDKTTGLWRVDTTKGVRPPAEVYALIDKWADKNGYTRERGTQIASRILEGVRLDAMRTSNKNDGTEFLLHMKDAEIDQLLREYKADPDLQAMSKLMDEARLAMVDNMVAVGRLSPEQGQAWKDAAGYVPFDRLEDFAEKFSKIKKISNKGLAQVGKLPELVGSLERPVGNVFDNYLNTLGWMVGQTMKTDGTVHTLRALEDLGQAKFLGRSNLSKPNAVGMYVGGEMMYWDLPSKYDVLAFKDLNPPKAHWLRALGEFSNVLRKSVTVLPPFALKQVTDDVQRAILTSGVKSPGALLRMSLTNFPKLALAELRGIQHPMVREFGALGLTGEYDFQAGKPATSLLKDLGYKKRGKFETLLHRLDGITRASDLSVRKAIYDQTLKETNDQLLAQTRAREFINFRRRGASDFVGAMVTVIPFFNAYIQGMDVLYRAASGKDSSSSVDRAQARRLFWSRAGTVMMLASLYAVGKDDDDEDYKEMDLRTRDGNWILPGGYKIPVPGELGALFKVIPERVVEYMKRQGTPEEQDAWEATRTALTYMYEQYIGRATPVPQAVKPLIEAWSNKSFLTGRPLEGFHHQQMDPSMRRTEQTSELAVAIANFSRDMVGVEVSPIMVDNTLRGYFGSTAALLTATTDSLLNPTRVDRPLHKWAMVSNYMYDPVGTRRMTEFYEEREKVGKAGATLRELLKTDLDKAATYAEEHADELQFESAINSTLQQLENTRAYRKHLNSVEGAKEMSAEDREAQLKEIKQTEVQLVGWLREAKAALRQ